MRRFRLKVFDVEMNRQINDEFSTGTDLRFNLY